MSTRRISSAAPAKGGILGISRRNFLQAGATAALAAPFVIRPRGARAADSIVVVDDGGTVQEAKREIFSKRFTADTGIEVIDASNSTTSLDRLQAQVMTGQIEWDVVYLTGQAIHAATKRELVEQLDAKMLDTSKSVHQEWVLATGLCCAFFTGGIGYNPATHPMGKHPRTYKEFWDVEGMPGRRGMMQKAIYALEMALAADGVAPDKIYPIDYARAFASLDKIKDHVAVWMSQNEQAINMIQTGEVDFDFTFSGRVYTAQKGGVSVDFVADNSTISGPSYVGIPKGTKKKEIAMQYLNYVNRADLQAELAKRVAIAPENGDAYALIEPAVLEKLPKLGSPNAISLDLGWWGENSIQAEERFKEWILT